MVLGFDFRVMVFFYGLGWAHGAPGVMGFRFLKKDPRRISYAQWSLDRA